MLTLMSLCFKLYKLFRLKLFISKSLLFRDNFNVIYESVSELETLISLIMAEKYKLCPLCNLWVVAVIISSAGVHRKTPAGLKALSLNRGGLFSFFRLFQRTIILYPRNFLLKEWFRYFAHSF